LVKNFKLEEEEKSALLLHLRKLFAESAVSGSATVLGCRLVVATVQAIDSPLGIAASSASRACIRPCMEYGSWLGVCPKE
jgi:Ca2+/Na+ antiporter